jgi:hypothetical protein
MPSRDADKILELHRADPGATVLTLFLTEREARDLCHLRVSTRLIAELRYLIKCANDPPAVFRQRRPRKAATPAAPAQLTTT